MDDDDDGWTRISFGLGSCEDAEKCQREKNARKIRSFNFPSRCCLCVVQHGCRSRRLRHHHRRHAPTPTPPFSPYWVDFSARFFPV